MASGGSRPGAGRKRKDPALNLTPAARAAVPSSPDAPLPVIPPLHLSDLAQLLFADIVATLAQQGRAEPQFAQTIALLAQRLEQIQRWQAVLEMSGDTDVKITTDEGTCLRERIVAVAQQDRQSGLAPTSRPLVITNALLNYDGSVVQDADGRFCISSPHEVVFTNETIGRLGSAEAVTAAMLDAREIAAGFAEMEFKGMRLFDQVLSARTLAASKTTANNTPA